MTKKTWKLKLKKDFLIEEYIQNRKSPYKIARKLKCANTSVYYWLIKYNIPRRTISESKKGTKATLKTRKKMSKIKKELFKKGILKIWNKNKKLSKKTRKKISKALKNNPNIKHHIYLRKNNDKILKLSRSKHRQLHERAYDYIYHTYRKKGIDNYIKWFDKNYRLIK